MQFNKGGKILLLFLLVCMFLLENEARSLQKIFYLNEKINFYFFLLPNKVLKAQLEDSEKMKNLMKLKTKYEAQVSDVEERLRKELELRQRLEKQIRQLELELSEARDQVAERGQQVHELQKREAELTSVFTKSEVDYKFFLFLRNQYFLSEYFTKSD